MRSSQVAARLWKSSFLLLLVETTSLYGQNVSSSRKLCIPLGNDDKVQMYLTSSEIYYKISQALFPSPGSPSLYVKIFVQFNSSSSSNNSFKAGNQKKYTWSKSCLYVATQFISLSAINVYSVSAVWPNRRSAELFITIPQFCNATEEEVDAKMIYFLSTLEDVAINNKTQDPRLNTVECVVEGHNDFRVKTFSGIRKLLIGVCWSFGIISFVVGYVLSSIVIERLKDDSAKKGARNNGQDDSASAQAMPLRPIIGKDQQDGSASKVISYLAELIENDKDRSQKRKEEEQKCKNDAIQILICVLAVIEHILAILAFYLAITHSNGRNSYVYPLVYLLFLHVFFNYIFYLLENGLQSCNNMNKIELILLLFGPIGSFVSLFCSQSEKFKISDTIINLTLLMTVHHFLWILVGVMTEPLWAIPVLVLNGCIWFCIYLSAYYFVKYGSKLSGGEKCRLVLLSFFVIISIILALLVLGVIAQSFLATDPLTGIVSSALSIVATWFLKKLV